MRRRIPLFPQILGWFFLNLLFLGAGLFLLFHMQFRIGTDSLLAGAVGERVQLASELIAAELRNAPTTNWNAVLDRFGKAYQSDLQIFRADGTHIAGATMPLPEALREKINERRGMGEGMMGRGPPAGKGPRWGIEGVPPSTAAELRFLVHTTDPPAYWIGVRLPLSEPAAPRPWPVTLLIATRSLLSGGLFLDPRPWVLIGLGAFVFSIVFWIPFVRSLTRALGRMTRATRRIANGDFEARVHLKRGDELGKLSESIDQMAARLSGFVTGQKRFLGDIAHELCSPLARIQVALGLLEQKAEAKPGRHLEDLREDVQEMSSLVNELLSFSKASLGGRTEPLELVDIALLLQRAAARETGPGLDLRVDISGKPVALGRPDLLLRAVSNLLRNTVRHAGGDGPVLLAARCAGGDVEISVRDEGPGVAPGELQRIFDPFYRADASRNRDTGGVGLGLAIVKTCIEACQGTVTARNRSPRGFEVTLRVKAAKDESSPS